MPVAVLRTTPWPEVAGVTGVATLVGGCGVAFPDAGSTLIAIAFALLAAAGAFVLDEPGSQVVDVTPTGTLTRTAIRALALLVPLVGGAVLIGAGALRAIALPWPAVTLALAGNVLLGFTAACVARSRTGEPGAGAATAVVLALIAWGLLPPLTRWGRTFPSTTAEGSASQTLWCCVVAACLVAIAATLSGRFAGRRASWRAPAPDVLREKLRAAG
jgi:hypothetical protein